MAYIKVDHSKFSTVSASIALYTLLVRNKKMFLNGSVSNLRSSWKGDDYTVFENQWSKATDDDSSYKKYMEMLKNYGNIVSDIGKKYKDAQAKAVNSANNIPTW